MSGRVLVLGAAGRFGFAVAEAFQRAGWDVTSLVRPGSANRAARGTKVVETTERPTTLEAARGMDVVLHALNPRLPDWQRFALPHAYAAIEAAESAGASLIFPGNLYNFGAQMPEMIDETTPMRPTSHKGRIRVQIEQRMREASDRGLRVIIIRAGDFFGGGRGSWFDLVMAKDIGRDLVTYPGPLDVVHEWAYLPDLAQATVRLAAARERLGPFETFGFAGHSVTGEEFSRAMARALRRRLRIKPMSWWLIHALSPFAALPREISEIGYLWKIPHRIAGEKLRATIGELPHTPLDTAVANALRALHLHP